MEMRSDHPSEGQSGDDLAAADLRAALIAALAWQCELGVDETIAEEPINRTLAPPKTPARPSPKDAKESPAPQQYDAVADARALSASAADIPALRAALSGFEGSSLKAGARSTVFADGDPAAEIMVIGEAPGRDEDRQGLPFVGRSGQLLDRMLAAIGRNRRDADPAKGAYITNVIPYRPLENRTPDDQEVRLLTPFIERHIALARPSVAICLGNVPAKHLMGAKTGITKFRGTWTTLEIDGIEIPAIATFHPAYLLRSPDMKRLAWRDLLSVQERLEP